MCRKCSFIIVLLVSFSQLSFACGVTFITHGYASDTSMDWVYDFGNKLVHRIGSDANVALYKLVLTETGFSFDCENGVEFGSPANTTGHAVVMIDWTIFSTGIVKRYSTVDLSVFIVNYLLDEHMNLLAVPLHLIGHSRGGSLVGSIAEQLGMHGIWVDQVSFLDPCPTHNPWGIQDNDWGYGLMTVPGNVIFADCYYRTGLLPNGESVDTAYNVMLNGSYLIPIGYHDFLNPSPAHSDVHAWYRGTIPVDSPPINIELSAGFQITSEWYNSNAYQDGVSRPRTSSGYAYSLIANNGTNRPSSGLHSRINGDGVSRMFAPAYPNPVDNVGYLSLRSTTVDVGGSILADYRYESWSTNFGVEFFLDYNKNPYDGYGSSLGAVSLGISDGMKGANAPATLKVPVDQQAGSYYVFIKTTGSILPRYFYAPIRLGVGISSDLSGDGKVNLVDLAELSRNWLLVNCSSQNHWCEGADINHSGSVDENDLFVMSEVCLDGIKIPADFVVIPAGTFQMGDSKGEGYSWELPVHTVTLDSFAMSKYEITNGQFCAFLKSAYPSQLKVYNGIVYASGDTVNRFPYCDTSTSSSYSQIAFSNNTFSVRTKSGRDMTNDPMVRVSWYGAVAYCNWRSQQEGKQPCYNLSTWICDFTKNGYRLPTEAEWEYAARGGLSGKRFPWGDTINQNQANFLSSSSDLYDVSPVKNQYHLLWNDGVKPYTSPVGFFNGALKYKSHYNWSGTITSYQTTSGANAYGLYDMAGNVWEWCHDWYGGYSSTSQTNPTGPVQGTIHVVRGGCWLTDGTFCRVSYRNGDGGPVDNHNFSGFRLALSD